MDYYNKQVEQIKIIDNKMKQGGYKKKASSQTMEDAIARVNSNNINEWARFLELAQEQKNTRNGDKGVAIYVSSDIKRKLDLLKIGLDCPSRYLLNAAIQVFLESNKDKVDEQLANVN